MPDGVISGWPGDTGRADWKVRMGPYPTRPPPQGGASPLVIPPAMYFFPPCPGGGGPRATLPSVRASRQACGPNAAGRGDSHGRYIHRSRLNLPRWRHRPRCIRNSAGGWRPACGHRRLGDGSTGHTHAMGILRRGMPSRPSWLPCWRLTSKQGERLTIPMAGPTKADFSTLVNITRARAKWLGRLDASWTIRPAYL